jgi:hypothetical protein
MKELLMTPTSLHPMVTLKTNDYGLPTLPSPFGHRSKTYFLTTDEFSMFLYSILKEKDMIGISIVAPNLFLQLQGLCLKTISTIL